MHFRGCSFWIFVSSLLCGLIGVYGVTVNVKQGLITGTKVTMRNGKVIDKFLHVPYAQPPVGKRRFKDPEPVKPWPGVWNATNDKFDLMKCIQFYHEPGGPNKVEGHEDCLYLNIYTPKTPQDGAPNPKWDVIFYIHGGAFMFGQGFIYEPYPLLEEHDVVYISINYRLGPLGFLSTGDDVVPGNMGLKDQTQALRWVKENIAQFGGNPDSITITGMSAGGASVHLLMMNPQAEGLFQRAVSMSGTSLNPWVIAENLPAKTKFIANYLGCPVNCNKKMIECLQARPAPLIANAVGLLQPFTYNPFSPWGPTVDSFAKNPILPDYPSELLKQGEIADIPWLNSVTTAEGLYPGAEFLASEENMKHLNENWISLAPHILDYNFTVPDNLKDKIAEEVRRQYLGDKPINLENQKEFIQLISDRMFNVDAERATRFQSQVNKAPIYFYEFDFQGRHSLSNHYGRNTERYGCSHGDDTLYVVQVKGNLLENTTEMEQKTIDFMTNLWTSFAKTGKPHISSWKPVTSTSFNYLRIDSGDDYKMVENAKELGSRSFWETFPFDEKNAWNPPTAAHSEL